MLIGGDTLAERKPHPLPLQVAAQRIGLYRKPAFTLAMTSATYRPHAQQVCRPSQRCGAIA